MKSRKRLQRPSRQPVEPPAERMRPDGSSVPIDDDLQKVSSNTGYDLDGASDQLQYRTRPNKAGGLFIAFGALLAFTMVIAVRAGTLPWFLAIWVAPIVVLLIAVGVKTMKGEVAS